MTRLLMAAMVELAVHVLYVIAWLGLFVSRFRLGPGDVELLVLGFEVPLELSGYLLLFVIFINSAMVVYLLRNPLESIVAVFLICVTLSFSLWIAKGLAFYLALWLSQSPPVALVVLADPFWIGDCTVYLLLGAGGFLFGYTLIKVRRSTCMTC